MARVTGTLNGRQASVERTDSGGISGDPEILELAGAAVREQRHVPFDGSMILASLNTETAFVITCAAQFDSDVVVEDLEQAELELVPLGLGPIV